MRDWELPDGSCFSTWTSSQNQAGLPCYIWADLDKGSIMYRIISAGKPGDWKPMSKSKVTANGELVSDPDEIFHGIEVLQSGSYKVEFKVGEQILSAIKLKVK